MASVSRKAQGGRTGWRIRFYIDDRRREIYLALGGKKSESMANKIAVHIENLAQSKAKGVSADPAAIAWANSTDGSLRDNLVSWGLAEPVNRRLMTDQGRYLGAFCDAYIESRTDLKERTIINYKQVRRLLVEYFTEKKSIHQITHADADRWRRWMLARKIKADADQTMAVSTVSKHVKRAKTMFAEAVADRLLKESPFAKLKGGNETNPERQRFIDRATSKKILDGCPDADWRCIFALARFGGLRCPSEVLGLKWSDVDWEGGKLRIDSPKTGLRFCPLFPELRAVLSEAFGLAADGSVYIVNRYQGSTNLGPQFGRIIERVGVPVYPKLFVNLRSTRRTELQEQFPDHVINSWLGHSSAVASKHYLQVTDDHWASAVSFGSPTGSPISDQTAPISNNHQNDKTPKNIGSDVSWGHVMSYSVPPLGLEPRTY
ncbi:MAG TPA: phage integrase SAM-like domain-containing protein [Pirellulaceae bacterium]|nr:phage integrase SAM-like domain-containing protein [Pirellulaceae bacterium]HMP69390.1 phage integrase SAM-like domain-containing protein [Pirellulaceae bacterium]